MVKNKSSKFDIDFSRKYHALLKARKKIAEKLIEIGQYSPDDFKTHANEFAELHAQNAEYQQNIYDMLIDEQAFEKYAKKLFDTSISTIVNDKTLTKYALNFAKLSDQEFQDFGQRFLNIYTKLHQLEQVYFNSQSDTITHDVPAYYNDTNKEIAMSAMYCKNLDDFIGQILHEFTHHIYWYNPEYGPIGAQKSFAAIRSGYGDPGYDTIEQYKRRPFEAPAYSVQDYVSSNKFTNVLIQRINTKNILTTPQHD